MAKNQFGFISNRYKQPIKYELIFANWCGVYRSEKDGKKYYLEAIPSYLASNKQGAEVWRYEITWQDVDCRRRVGGLYKTQKEAFDVLSKYL